MQCDLPIQTHGLITSQDVKENTVVAGNPAKAIRSVNNAGSSGDGQADRRYSLKIEERNEKVKKEMDAYVNSGFNRYSKSTRGEGASDSN